MTTHTVHATITVEVSNSSILGSIGGGGDERSQVERALQAGLRELPAIGQRYGFTIIGSEVSVD